jgi:hypothetical protein
MLQSGRKQRLIGVSEFVLALTLVALLAATAM